MLKQILGVISTRYLIAILNLALIFINAKVLGAEGMGTVGLIWAAININVSICSVLGGNTIVYFMHKYPVSTLFPISTLWILGGSTLGCFVMQTVGILPSGYQLHIYFITVLYSVGLANSRFLLGSDNITGFNLTNLLQGGLLFFSLLFIYFVTDKGSVDGYVSGMYIANTVTVVISLLMMLPCLRHSNIGKPDSNIAAVREMFKYGMWSVTDNMAETFTTRLNYFLVEHFLGRSFVGLLDAGTKISESVWNISRSVAYIEYNRIAKTNNRTMQKQITIKLLKYTFYAVLLLTVCVMLIPEWTYTDYIFSSEFKGVKSVILALSPGIVMLGCNTIFSHYFIGSGKIKYSSIASILGLSVLLASGTILIPALGVTGSAISSSAAFSAMMLFSLIIFVRQTGASWRDFINS